MHLQKSAQQSLLYLMLEPEVYKIGSSGGKTEVENRRGANWKLGASTGTCEDGLEALSILWP